MAKDKATARTRCPECNGAGYVEAPAGDESTQGETGSNRLFSGGYIRVMRLR